MRLQSGAHPGARALCIAALRTVSGPEGSSTKEESGECRRSPGFHGGLPSIPGPGSPIASQAPELSRMIG